MVAVPGTRRKAVVLVASGLDTFSKITFDTARKSLQESGVPIYSVSILQIARMSLERLVQDDALKGPYGIRTPLAPCFPARRAESLSYFQQFATLSRNQPAANR